MKTFVDSISINSKEQRELIDITGQLRDSLRRSKIYQGQITIATPHTTAALLINEDEPNLKKDFEKIYRLINEQGDFGHHRIDNNGASHLTASLLGQSLSLIVKDGEPILGPWQKVFFFELAGPRKNRKIDMLIIGRKKASKK